MPCLGVQWEYGNQFEASKTTMGQMRKIWMRTANGVRDLKNVNRILRMTQKGWFKDEKTQK